MGQEDYEKCPDCGSKAEACAEIIADLFADGPDDGMWRYRKCTESVINCEEGVEMYLEQMLPECVRVAMQNMDQTEQEEFLRGNDPGGYGVLLNKPPANTHDTKKFWEIIAPVVQEEIMKSGWQQARLRLMISDSKERGEPLRP